MDAEKTDPAVLRLVIKCCQEAPDLVVFQMGAQSIGVQLRASQCQTWFHPLGCISSAKFKN